MSGICQQLISKSCYVGLIGAYVSRPFGPGEIQFDEGIMIIVIRACVLEMTSIFYATRLCNTVPFPHILSECPTLNFSVLASNPDPPTDPQALLTLLLNFEYLTM